MSSNVDHRIVEMQFNNRQFEDGVQTSIKSLKDLNKSLELDEAGKSLNNLSKITRAFTLDPMTNAIMNVQNKFSTLGIMGITVIQNLTNSAINYAKNLVSALTIDSVKTGLNEYETKMNAITTILTNTASKGTTLDDVTKALNELNEYADLTIYNFAEMTRNIGTFTAAGVDLKTSTTSIKGIANLAAGSGSTAQQAATAMYQLSQAIASGTVKLMDWNSVVNAGMGGELFQKALEKTANELGRGRNMAVSFRESLQDGWLTTEVLTKTLAKLAKDESLLKAATQVKTVTQLIDTMKESVQSGWAISWEHIIGNKDQATKLLTAISDAFNKVSGASAEARNNMLAYWNANGGRVAALQGLANVLSGLSSVLKPIEKAFREIFPPMTGKHLVEISKNFRDLTQNFKMGEETSDKLRRTFKGLFAVLDMGKQAVSAVAKGTLTLTKYLFPAGDGILSITAKIGDFLVALRDGAVKTDIFNKSVGKIVNVIAGIGNGVKKIIVSVKESFKEFSNIDTSGLDAFSEKLKFRFEPLTKFGQIVEFVFSKVGKVLSAVAPITYKMVELIGKGFSKLRDNIVNSEYDSIFDFLNSGIIMAALLGLTKIINSLSKVASSAGGILDGVTSILDGVRGTIETYQSNIKANVLLKIAIAMGILSASLVAISTIDSKKLTESLGAMTLMFTELFGAMAIFEKLMGVTGLVGMGKLTTAMVGLSVAVLILTSAVTKLSKLDWEGLKKGLVGVAGLSGILIASAKLLENNSAHLIRASLGFIAFGAAINILVSAVRKLGEIDTGKMAKGLVGVGVLTAELALFMNSTNFKGFGTFKGLGLIALAGALVIISTAVEKISAINTGNLIKGLVSMGVILAELMLFINLTIDAKRVVSTATGMVILGSSMLIFAKAIETMGNLSWEQISKGLLTMGVALGEIAIAMKLMPKNMLATAPALVIIASSLLILSKALNSMGNMTWTEIAKGLITLAGSLTIISAAMIFMSGALPGAAALLVIAGALAILAPVLKILGSMNLAEIGLSLLALVGVFTVVGTAGLLLSPLIPVLLGLSAAIALLGAGCLAVGAGILAFSAGLTALAVSGTAGAAALTAIVTSIVGLIPFAMKTLAQGMIDFIRILGDNAPIIANGIKELVSEIVKTLIPLIPVIVDALFKLLDVLLRTIVEYTPKIVDAGMKIIIGFLKGISDNIQDVVEVAIEIVINFIKGITNMLPKIIQAGFDMIVGFINGLANALRGNTKPLMDAVKNLFSAILDFGISILSTGIDLIKIVGEKIINSGFIQGIKNKISSIKEAFSNIIKTAIDFLTIKIKDFADIGKNIIDGLINGIKTGINNIKNTIGNVANSILDTAKSALGIHSPSKMFKEIGQNITAGLTQGIDTTSKDAVKSSENMSKEVTKASSNVVKKSNESAKEAFDKSVAWIDERKYYNQLSLQEELTAWEGLQKKYKDGTEERKKADREVYRVKQELIKMEADLEKTRYQQSLDWIDERKYFNELSLIDELAAWRRVQTRYKEGTEERKKVDRELYRVEQEFVKKQEEVEKERYNQSVKMINDRKYYNEITLVEELQAWEQIQSRYALGTKEREDAEKEIYRLKNEITNKIKQLGDDYYNTTHSINEKLKEDIRSLTEEYENAVKARADSIYNTYSLFDEISKNEDEISGKKLIENLTGQIESMSKWQFELSSLSARGIEQGLIDELTAMGPKVANQIQALNTLSDSELGNYVTLWKMKHELAKNQATSELEGLKVETKTKIQELKDIAEKELKTYRLMWVKEMNGLVVNVKNITSSQNWDGVGKNIISGIVKGMQAELPNLMGSAKVISEMTLTMVKSTLGIHSPSKEFAKIGTYAIEGFTSGLKNLRTVADSSKEVANTATSSLRNALSNVTNILDSSVGSEPVIKPVMDLSNIKSGAKSIGGIFSSIDVSKSVNKLSSINNQNGSNHLDSSPKSGGIQFNQYNYSPKSLSRIEIYRQTKNQINSLKGVIGK